MSTRTRAPGDRPRVAIIVQNLPVPFDRRVWLECRSLVDRGYDVTVICPQGQGTGPSQVIEGVRILAYRGYAPGGSALGYVLEYAWSFLATAWLMRAARREGPFDVLQACNPADIFWPIARWLRRREGTRFVFDHHDLCPELYLSRFDGAAGAPYTGLLFLERETFRAADRVTSTNESYAAIASSRGGKPAEHVTVVRTGPDPERFFRREPVPLLRRGRKHLVAYLGVMGPQDGVDLALAAADVVVNQLGRHDIAFTFMGSGDCYDDLVRRRDELGLTEAVDLTGRVPDDFVWEVLSTADVGLCPDPLNPLNDVSTMNKTMEYMAFELPVVAFDLRETRVSAADAAHYVRPNDVDEYARAIVSLIDDPSRREEMGRQGRARVVEHLSWEHQREGYLRVFDELVSHAPGRALTDTEAPDVSGTPQCLPAGDGKVLVTAMSEQIAHRGPDAGPVVELVDPHPAEVLGPQPVSIIDLRSPAEQQVTKGGVDESLVGMGPVAP